MTASFITCQDSQVAIFNHLDNDGDPLPVGSIHLDAEVLAHVSQCKACQHYQKELSVLMDGLKNHDALQANQRLIINNQKMDQLAEKVWNRLLQETDLESLSDSKEASVIRFSSKPARSKTWWSQPVAPMAAAAALVVMAGFSYLQFGNFSQPLGLQSAYVSPDYELDGQKLVYDSADQILDPTWIEDSSTNTGASVSQNEQLSKQNSQLSAQSKAASVLLSDEESDPLKQFVGF
jgi:hypothetical protein